MELLSVRVTLGATVVVLVLGEGGVRVACGWLFGEGGVRGGVVCVCEWSEWSSVWPGVCFSKRSAPSLSGVRRLGAYLECLTLESFTPCSPS